MSRRILFGVLLSAVMLALILYRIDLNELTAALRSVHVPTLLAGALALLSTLIIRSWRWHYLLAPVKQIQFSPLLSSTTIGAMIDMLMPARFGDIVRGVLIGQREQISKISALATIVVEKMFDILTLALFALSLLVYLGFSTDRAILPYGFGATVTTTVLLLVATGTILWLLQSRTEFMAEVTQKLFGWLPVSWLDKLMRGLRAFADGLQGMNRGPYLPQVLLLSVLLWAMFAFSNYLILRSFGLQLPPYASVLILIFQILGVTLPSSPGFIGTYHAAVLVAFGMLGVNQGLALGVAVTMHAAFFFPFILAGLLFLWRENLSFQGLWSLGAERSSVATGWQADSQQEIQ